MAINLNTHRSIDIQGRPIQQACEQWDAFALETAASVLQRTFTQASILPNRTILEHAREASKCWRSAVPIALMAHNESWSVYVVGLRAFALSTYDGETIPFDSLSPSELEELDIPTP